MKSSPEQYRLFLQTLTPRTLTDLANYVTPDVRFKDPFNDVCGAEAMELILANMFKILGNVSFDVHNLAKDGRTCILSWSFRSKLRGKQWTFDGTSVIFFDEDGRVREHVDHWDAARDFYEYLPVVGWLLRKVRKRIAAH